MSTFIAAVIYGTFAAGYVAMLVLTERTAGRYVRGEIRVRYARTALVVTARHEPAPVTHAATSRGPLSTVFPALASR